MGLGFLWTKVLWLMKSTIMQLISPRLNSLQSRSWSQVCLQACCAPLSCRSSHIRVAFYSWKLQAATPAWHALHCLPKLSPPPSTAPAASLTAPPLLSPAFRTLVISSLYCSTEIIASCYIILFSNFSFVWIPLNSKMYTFLEIKEEMGWWTGLPF